MTKFTKEIVDKYADKLLIGLTDEENKMVLDEFEIIDKNIDMINRIPDIDEVEPMSWCLDREIDDLRSDTIEEGLSMDDLLKNASNKTEVEVVVPKVVD